MLQGLFLSLFVFSSTLSAIELTEREKELVAHVDNAINVGAKSKLNESVLKVPGMTSGNIKHLMNNICSLKKCRYLEIGVWKGATFTAALFNNVNINEAIAIDNWSEWGGPKDEFIKHCFLINNIPFSFHEQDCFEIDVRSLFTGLVDIYFYDGSHTEEAQELAFTYYNSILADSFIAIIDDWNHPTVPVGTYKAFNKLGYTILYEKVLGGHGPDSTREYRLSWHNGFYIAIIRKCSSDK